MKIKNIVPLMSILVVSVPTQGDNSLTLSSSEFADKELMSAKYTCEGEGISPPLTSRGLPDGSQSLVVIMDHQPDAKPIRNK